MAEKRGNEGSLGGHKPDVFVTGISNAAFQVSVNDVTNDTNEDATRLTALSTPATDRHVVTSPSQRRLSEKDKGYAWVILIACITCNLISSCGMAISGVLLLELAKTFEATELQYNIAATMQIPTALSLSMIVGLLVSRFGPRKMMMIGSLITTASVFATSFAPSITVFTVVYLLSAFGISCEQLSGVVICSQYFDKHKALAFGLLAFGFSVCDFAWPPFAAVLFDYYGWRSGFMIIAGIQLQVCVLGSLLRPYIEEKVQVDEKPSSGCYALLSQCTLFKNKRCMFLLVVTTTGNIPLMFCPAYCPTIGTGLGTTATNAALLVSIYGAFSGVSRVANGYIGDRSWMRPNRLLIAVYGYIMAGVLKLCIAAVTSYPHAIIYAVAEGFANGTFSSVTYTLVTDLVDPQLVPLASGICSMGLGIAMLLGNMFSGWLYSYFRTLQEPAFVLGSTQLLTAMLAICLYIHVKLRNRKECNMTNSTTKVSTDL